MSDSLWPHGLCTHWVRLSMGFSRHEYWSGLPCPPPGNLLNPGMEPASLLSSALVKSSLPLAHLGNRNIVHSIYKWLGPVRILVLVCRWPSSLCPHMAEREIDHLSCVFFFPKGTNPIHEGLTLMTWLLLKTPPPDIITVRTRVSRGILERHKHSVHNTWDLENLLQGFSIWILCRFFRKQWKIISILFYKASVNLILQTKCLRKAN